MSNRALAAAPPDLVEQDRVARLWPLLVAVIGSRDPRLAKQLTWAHYVGLDDNRRLCVERLAPEAVRYAQNEGRLNVLWALSLLLGDGYDLHLVASTTPRMNAALRAYNAFRPPETPTGT